MSDAPDPELDILPPELAPERCPCCDGTGRVVLTGDGAEDVASSNPCPVCGSGG